MNTFKAPLPGPAALSVRLGRLVELDASETEALQFAERQQRRAPARRELVVEGSPIRERCALISGWACQQRILSDGRRQILSFLLPGDLIGVRRHSYPLASTTILGITELTLCAIPAAEAGSGLADAYARSTALEEHYLLAQIMRLGRMNAYERLADWLLETRERLEIVGLSDADQLPLPLTQEILADALGLTSVHVNRTLQAMRRDGLLALRGGIISFPDRGRLEKLVDYQPARVSSASRY